jgi:flagellar motor switch protein FliN/FliY
VDLSDIQSLDPQDDVVAITFDLTIEGVIRSEFVTVMEMEFAKKLSERLVNMQNEEPAPAPEPQPATPRAAQADIQSPIHQQPSVQQQVPQQDPAPGMYPPPPYPYAMPGYGYQQPYPYPYPQPQQAPVPPQSPVNVQQVQLHQFESFDNVSLTGDQKENLKLLMSVPLEVSVEIGSARKKVKEILEFQQGTIIELERQAGAPVDVVVNGNLIARGDVVVVDDNFAVRITEIVKSKFMDSLGKE